MPTKTPKTMCQPTRPGWKRFVSTPRTPSAVTKITAQVAMPAKMRCISSCVVASRTLECKARLFEAVGPELEDLLEVLTRQRRGIGRRDDLLEVGQRRDVDHGGVHGFVRQ